jgi:hypothetical protein
LRTEPSPKDRQHYRDHVGGSPKDRIILWNLYLPRTLLGMLVGVDMALAQTSTTLLDEPTTQFDLGYHWEVMELLEHLKREYGVTVVMALHDLQQAVWSAHRFILSQEGRLGRQGPARQVLTSAPIAATCGVKGQVVWDAEAGRRLCSSVDRSDRHSGGPSSRREAPHSG